MKAIVIHELGDTDKLKYTESHPIPAPAAGEILIKIELAGVNFADVYFRTGHYPSATGYPLVLGLEAVGTITDLREPNPLEFQIGDRVLFSNVLGAYAEYVAIPADKAVKVRPDISNEDAVGGYTVGLTALSLIEQGYSATKGQTVLVHAAAGGVGLTLCQLLSDRGVIVIGTASDDAKFAVAMANGAQHMVNYRKLSAGIGWVDQVKRLTAGQGVDAVFDSVGLDTWEGSFEATKLRGKVVFFGTSSGRAPPIDLFQYSRKRNISVLQSALVNAISTRDELEQYTSRVQELIATGKIRINKHKTYQLQDVAQAHQDLEARKTTGKLFVKV